jgi:hypothetical protein
MAPRNGRVRGVTRREPVLAQQALGRPFHVPLPQRRDLVLREPPAQRGIARKRIRFALP